MAQPRAGALAQEAQCGERPQSAPARAWRVREEATRDSEARPAPSDKEPTQENDVGTKVPAC